MSKNIILGYGILGREIVNQTNWDYLSRSTVNSFDFNNSDTYDKYISDYDTIINCVAYTDTYSKDKVKHWDTNYKAVSDLVEICNKNKQKIVHISSDYIYSGSKLNANINDVPVHNKTWYSYTKLLGDAHVQLKSDHYLNHLPKSELVLGQGNPLLY